MTSTPSRLAAGEREPDALRVTAPNPFSSSGTFAPARSSPGSPLAGNKALPFKESSEYSMSFKAWPTGPVEKSTRRGNANTAELWLPIGADKYDTETRAKFPGHAPPPAAPRPVPKWQASTLPFHDATTYKASFAGTHVSRPEIHKPQQQTQKLAIPLAAATEYRTQFKGSKEEVARDQAVARVEHSSPPKPFYGLTHYGEAFGAGSTSAPLARTLPTSPIRTEAAGTTSASLAPATGFGTKAAATGSVAFSPLRAPPSGAEATGFAATKKAAPGVKRLGNGPSKVLSTTTYRDLDSTGADPWKLMKLLYEDGSTPGVGRTDKRR